MVWEVRSECRQENRKPIRSDGLVVSIPIKEIDGRGSRVRHQIQAVGLIKAIGVGNTVDGSAAERRLRAVKGFRTSVCGDAERIARRAPGVVKIERIGHEIWRRRDACEDSKPLFLRNRHTVGNPYRPSGCRYLTCPWPNKFPVSSVPVCEVPRHSGGLPPLTP